jgi:hypothetical protein
MQLKEKCEYFGKEGFERLYSPFSWSKKVLVHELGGSTTILRSMTPVNRRDIDLSQFIARPLVFVPTETLASIATRDERTLFEDLPIFDYLSNFLFTTKGSFKYFRADTDVRLAKSGDYFLVLGENSEKLFAYLKNCGAKLTKTTPDELREKTK